MRCAVACGIALVFIASSARAQVTVQQPVVQSFGASTTISVPDRGRAHIAGVNSGAWSRSITGPIPSGYSVGREIQGRSISASVFIHDLREMDEAVLASARSSTRQDDVWSRRLAERRSAQPPAAIVERESTPQHRAAELEAWAQRAEERGKPAVALVYWRMASKEGSELAQSKLAEAASPTRAVAKSSRAP
jgi:hypothetical protein